MKDAAVALGLVDKSKAPTKMESYRRYCTPFQHYTTNFSFGSFLTKIFGSQDSRLFEFPAKTASAVSSKVLAGNSNNLES